MHILIYLCSLVGTIILLSLPILIFENENTASVVTIILVIGIVLGGLIIQYNKIPEKKEIIFTNILVNQNTGRVTGINANGNSIQIRTEPNMLTHYTSGNAITLNIKRGNFIGGPWENYELNYPKDSSNVKIVF